MLGKERLPLFYGAEKLMGESLREVLLSTSRMKGSLLFEQASGKNQLEIGSWLDIWALWLPRPSKLPSSLLLAVCLLLRAQMSDVGR